MTPLNGIGFISLGIGMWLLPAFAPEWFAHVGVDGTSTRALWVQFMAAVQSLTGVGVLIHSAVTSSTLSAATSRANGSLNAAQPAGQAGAQVPGFDPLAASVRSAPFRAIARPLRAVARTKVGCPAVSIQPLADAAWGSTTSHARSRSSTYSWQPEADELEYVGGGNGASEWQEREAA